MIFLRCKEFALANFHKRLINLELWIKKENFDKGIYIACQENPLIIICLKRLLF